MLPEGVARHWKMKRVSVFLISLMSFPILQVRLHFCITNVQLIFESTKQNGEKETL